jgi:hypothetical protein
MSPKLNTKVLGWGKIYQRAQTILSESPRNPTEWWIYELAKTVRKDDDAISLNFSESTLLEGFSISTDVFPACNQFFDDVCNLITMLPIKNGELIQRKLLIDLIFEAARECGTVWWYNLRERAAVVFGVMHACMIQRQAEIDKTRDELADSVSGMSLDNEDFAVMTELAGSLDGLKLDIGVEEG